MQLEVITNRGATIKYSYLRSLFSKAYEDWISDQQSGNKRDIVTVPLLSKPNSNTKLSKQTDRTEGYKLFSLFLAPSGSSGYNTCLWASDECISLCLNEAGRGAMKSVQDARIKKTKMMVENPYEFMYNLLTEMRCAVKSADKNGDKLAIRLNGTSDIAWESVAPFIKEFCCESDNDLLGKTRYKLYDYTKSAIRVKNKPDWYDMTLSYSGNNWEHCKLVLDRKISRVAVVFHEQIPETYKGYSVTNGDLDDYRFLDDKGVIVGLKYKSVGKTKDAMACSQDLKFVVKDHL